MILYGNSPTFKTVGTFFLSEKLNTNFRVILKNDISQHFFDISEGVTEQV